MNLTKTKGNYIVQNIIIRQETEKDRMKVYNLIKDTFKQAEHSDGNEHNLVERLRKSEAFIPELSLVAVADKKIIGHILFTKLKVGKTTQLALAPLTVTPLFQNQGIGSLLVKTGHKIAKEMGFEYSILLGSPKYYSRFGYKPSNEFNIICPFEVAQEYFMAINLQGKNSPLNAKVEYPKEFSINL